MANEKKVWVLTFEANTHDQYGEYFLAVFERKPTIQQLAEFFAEADETFANVMAGIAFLEHLLNGGGRRGAEERWYNLKQETAR